MLPSHSHPQNPHSWIDMEESMGTETLTLSR